MMDGKCTEIVTGSVTTSMSNTIYMWQEVEEILSSAFISFWKDNWREFDIKSEATS